MFAAHVQSHLQNEELRFIVLMDSESGIKAENIGMACLCFTMCGASAGKAHIVGNGCRGLGPGITWKLLYSHV